MEIVDPSHMLSDISRRQLLGVVGVSALSGCSLVSSNNSEAMLPILVAVQIANGSPQRHSVQFRVKRAPDLDTEPTTIASHERTVDSHSTVRISKGWEKVAGHYALEYKVPQHNWTQSDIAARLTQRKQICYVREINLSLSEDAETLKAETLTNVDAPCPDN